MPAKNEDLHGNVPDKAEVALLLIDVINDLEFPEGEQLLRHALPMAERIAALKRRARRGRHPGRSTSTTTSAAGSRTSTPRSSTASRTACAAGRWSSCCGPSEDDYFVLKPKHSGFFSTTLDILLEYLQVKTRDPDRHRRRTSACCSRPTTPTCATSTWSSRATAWPRTPRRRTATRSSRWRVVLKADTRPSAEIDFETLKQSGKRSTVERGTIRS